MPPVDPSLARWPVFPNFAQVDVSLRTVAGVLLLAVLVGCVAPANVKQIDRLAAVDTDNPRILVMTPDIKYYLLTASGIPEPNAEWTTAARRNFMQALQAYFSERSVEIKLPEDPFNLGKTEVAYQKLYSAVGTSIMIHHFGMAKLPTKQNSFDWSLGPGIKEIADKYGADYALFTYYRDYQASGGRVAFAILGAAVGVGVPVGSESGFASLIDLRTGDIVWFNHVAAGAGELRKENSARQTVDQLFKDIPEA
jgi:hypothetical protein